MAWLLGARRAERLKWHEADLRAMVNAVGRRFDRRGGFSSVHVFNRDKVFSRVIRPFSEVNLPCWFANPRSFDFWPPFRCPFFGVVQAARRTGCQWRRSAAADAGKKAIEMSNTNHDGAISARS